MTKLQFLNRLRRVNGLRVVDPWGDACRVHSFSEDSIWLSYEGLDVPFKRNLDAVLDAQNGTLLTDRRDQFLVEIMPGIALEFEPHWTAGEVVRSFPTVPVVSSSPPTLDELRVRKNLKMKR